jgi:alkaline phosphatase D
MRPVSSRRDFILRLTAVSAALGGGAALTACGGDDEQPEFLYGVASGDPLADRVILWTHARFPGSDDRVGLRWEVAEDAAFTRVVASG